MRIDLSFLAWAVGCLSLASFFTGCTTLSSSSVQELSLGNTLSMEVDAEQPGVRPRERVSLGLMGSEAEGRVGDDLASRALLAAVLEVSGSARRMAGELSGLKASKAGIGGHSSALFAPFVDHGIEHLRWVEFELAAASRWTQLALEMNEPESRLALLRLSGPRLEAAMLGSIQLAVWIDLLELTDVVLRTCPFFNGEQLFLKMCQWRDTLGPSMDAVSSRDSSRIADATADLPAVIHHLSGEFASTREAVRAAANTVERLSRVKDLVELLTTVSTLKGFLPRLSSATAPPLGMSLMVGANGLVIGSELVVSAEWVEMMRRLVQAGIISAPVVGAVVRIHAGQVLMAQSNNGLPQGVREALGEAPEVRGMHVTDRHGAGMAEPPRHHVLPREHREWFEKRGFTGEMSIDQFCVKMERASHEAIHGGGDWRLGRTWAGEWNRMIMSELRDAEVATGRMLTRSEILRLVTKHMRDYRIPMNFSPWRGQ